MKVRELMQALALRNPDAEVTFTVASVDIQMKIEDPKELPDDEDTVHARDD